MINLRIKVNLLNKEWYDDDGAGGKFIALSVWKKDEPDQYGNEYSVKQNAPREVRDALKQRGENLPFVGEGRMWNAVHKSPLIEAILERGAIDDRSLYKGEKHIFLDCSLSHVPAKDQGETDADYYVWQTPSKADRMRGKKGKRIGVAFRKEVQRKPDWDTAPRASAVPAAPTDPTQHFPETPVDLMDDDEIPF